MLKDYHYLEYVLQHNTVSIDIQKFKLFDF
jgi:hypothetical protein